MASSPPASLRRRDRKPVLWRVWPGLTDHSVLLEAMHEHAARVADGDRREEVWLVECPPGYSQGRGQAPDHLNGARVSQPVVQPQRGPMRPGSYSYHGPGVRIGIVMLDLAARRKDVATYVEGLHRWLIAMLAEFGIEGRRADFDPAGVWVGDNKIASIATRMRQWVTSYGFALNIAPDLADFAGIVPCGIAGKGVTSLAALGVKASMADIDAALRRQFEEVFGRTSRT